MQDKNLHKDIDLNNQKIERPFTSPEGYFEMLENELINKTILNQSPKFIKTTTFTVLKYAVAAVLAIGILISVVLINNSDNPKNRIAIEDKNKTRNSDQLQNQPESSHSDSKESIAVESPSNPNPTNSNQPNNNQIINPYIEQNSPNRIQQKENQNNEDVQLANQTKDNNTNHGQTPDNLNTINSPIYSQQISNGSGSQTKNGADVARVHKNEQKKVINLPTDTCSVSPVTLYAINDKSIWKEFNYQWSNGETSASVTLNSSGIYSVLVYKKGQRQAIDSATIKFNLVPIPEPNLGPDQTICSFESLSLNANTTNKAYEYSWSIGNCKTDALFINRLNAGEHKISVAVNACGHIETDEIIVTVNECILNFSNVITPNGDGKNDYFVITGLENFPRSALFIMNRNGVIIYENNNYQNDWNGQNLPAGTYFYMLKVKDDKGTEKGGSLTIVR